jgi:hypothetical protein
MTTMSFRSDDPTLNDLRIDHGALGALAQSLMSHPAYLDSLHPLHMQVVGEVSAAMEAMHGDQPVASGQQHPVMSFQTGPAQPGEPRT